MSNEHTQGQLMLSAVIACAAGLVAFGALMVIGDYDVSPAVFIAFLVTAAVAVFLMVAFGGGRAGRSEPAARPEVAPQQTAAAPAAAPVAAEPEPVVETAPEPVSVPKAAPAPAPVAAEDGPARLSAARDGRPDNLKKIKGVGPKLEALLHRMGFYHFDQIAGWTADEIAWVDVNLEGFKGRVSRDNWVEQAAKLAAGEETEFSSRVKKGNVY